MSCKSGIQIIRYSDARFLLLTNTYVMDNKVVILMFLFQSGILSDDSFVNGSMSVKSKQLNNNQPPVTFYWSNFEPIPILDGRWRSV